MDRLLSLFRDTKDANLGGADSFSDRLSCQYTVTILIIFAIMTTTRQYVCWTTSTYYLSENIAEIPQEEDINNKVSYYQWIPLMAVGQAAMFFLPRILWNLLNKKSGISVSSITDAAVERQRKADQCHAEKTMEFMVKSLGKFLKELSWDRTQDINRDGDKQRSRSLFGCYRWRKLYIIIYGNYLTCLYIFIKFIYISNIILQIFVLNGFLKTNYELYGFETIRKMLSGEDWTTSERFPRIAMCTFVIRAMGENMHRYAVQCAIPINLLHEIFYIFLWFWFIFLVIVTSFSAVSWCYLCFPLKKREKYVRNKLYADGILRRKPDPETELIFAGFVKCYLRRDGCFIARLVARNTSDVVAAELLGGLWKDYRLKTIKFKSMSMNCADDGIEYFKTGADIRSNAGQKRFVSCIDENCFGSDHASLCRRCGEEEICCKCQAMHEKPSENIIPINEKTIFEPVKPREATVVNMSYGKSPLKNRCLKNNITNSNNNNNTDKNNNRNFDHYRENEPTRRSHVNFNSELAQAIEFRNRSYSGRKRFNSPTASPSRRDCTKSNFNNNYNNYNNTKHDDRYYDNNNNNKKYANKNSKKRNNEIVNNNNIENYRDRSLIKNRDDDSDDDNDRNRYKSNPNHSHFIQHKMVDCGDHKNDEGVFSNNEEFYDDIKKPPIDDDDDNDNHFIHVQGVNNDYDINYADNNNDINNITSSNHANNNNISNNNTVNNNERNTFGVFNGVDRGRMDGCDDLLITRDRNSINDNNDINGRNRGRVSSSRSGVGGGGGADDESTLFHRNYSNPQQQMHTNNS